MAAATFQRLAAFSVAAAGEGFRGAAGWIVWDSPSHDFGDGQFNPVTIVFQGLTGVVAALSQGRSTRSSNSMNGAICRGAGQSKTAASSMEMTEFFKQHAVQDLGRFVLSSQQSLLK